MEGIGLGEAGLLLRAPHRRDTADEMAMVVLVAPVGLVTHLLGAGEARISGLVCDLRFVTVRVSRRALRDVLYVSARIDLAPYLP